MTTIDINISQGTIGRMSPERRRKREIIKSILSITLLIINITLLTLMIVL